MEAPDGTTVALDQETLAQAAMLKRMKDSFGPNALEAMMMLMSGGMAKKEQQHYQDAAHGSQQPQQQSHPPIQDQNLRRIAQEFSMLRGEGQQQQQQPSGSGQPGSSNDKSFGNQWNM